MTSPNWRDRFAKIVSGRRNSKYHKNYIATHIVESLVEEIAAEEREEARTTTNPSTTDWRKSEKAEELRSFIDTSFKVKKPSMGGLEREIIIDFVATLLSRKEEEVLEDWKESHNGKLWSKAVALAFTAPFPEVAVQHLLRRIDEKHQKELVNKP